MDGANPISTAMVDGLKLTKEGSNYMADPHLNWSTIGALQYATITSPEISFAVNKVCQFMIQPLEEHWTAVKRIMCYLKGTITYGLHFSPSSSLHLTGYCDADWTSDIDDRRSTSGFGLFLGSNLISWSAKKQQVVAHSSTKAEHRSIAFLVFEITWVQSRL